MLIFNRLTVILDISQWNVISFQFTHTLQIMHHINWINAVLLHQLTQVPLVVCPVFDQIYLKKEEKNSERECIYDDDWYTYRHILFCDLFDGSLHSDSIQVPPMSTFTLTVHVELLCFCTNV